jgi:predicted nucleic acid-binding protein
MPRRPANGQPEEPLTVYVETSVWGMTLANQPRALREPTRKFLRQCSAGLFLPYISTVVLEEIGRAEKSTQADMIRAIDKLAPTSLEPNEESERLADAYLRAGVIPAKKRDDARHVAIATVCGLKIVVSWNHRHIANERKRVLFNSVNRQAGYDEDLLIHTPFEVIQ